MIFILDKQLNALEGALNNETPKSCPYFNDEHTEQLDDGIQTYTFSAPSDHEVSKKGLVPENYIVFQGYDEIFRLYKIKESELDRGDKSIINVTAEDTSISELRGEIVRPKTLESYSAEQALAEILEPTDWEIGKIAYLGINTFEFSSYETTLKAIRKIASSYDGELRFRVEFDGVKVTGKYVDLVEQIGEDNGKLFDYEKDIKGLRRTEDSTELYTAVIGIGKSDKNGNRATFMGVEWSEENGNPTDKPTSQDWIGDDDALSRWGNNGKHIFGVYEDPNISSPTVLIKNSWEFLQKHNKPRLNYEVDAVLLGNKLGYEHESINLGDNVTIRDFTFEPELLLEARVIELRRSYTDPTKDEVVLGEFTPLSIDQESINETIRDLVTSNSGQWEDGGETIYKSTTSPSNPTNGQLWLDKSKTPNVLKRYDEGSSSWVKASPTNAEEVGAESEIHRGTSAPSDTSLLWIDESKTPNVWKVHDGSTWVKATPENADEIDESTSRKFAAESGADVTNNNTANDTNNVGGESSTSVKDKADSGKSAKDKLDNDVGSNTIESTSGSQSKANDAESSAKSHADTQANNAESSAKSYADSVAEAKRKLAEENAKAYADGQVSEEEQARIDQAEANLQEAKQHADTEASNAESSAKSHAETKASDAEQNAKDYTDSQLTSYVQATQYDNDISDIQAQIDNQITSHFKNYAPTLSNEPASQWTTDNEKDKHVGDLFYDTDTGYSYRFAKNNGSYEWVQVRDEGINKALQDAADAQDTADSKRRTFVDQPTTPYDKGDLWDNNGSIYRSTVNKSTSGSFSASDWTLIGDVTGENTSQDTSNVNGESSSSVKNKANEGQNAKSKLDSDVGSGTVESTSGSQSKANSAESSAKSHADTKANQAEENAKDHADTVSGQTLLDAKSYAVAQETYDTKVTEITNDLNEKAGVKYVDGELQLKQDDIPSQDTTPNNPNIGMLWLDTSQTPNIVKRYDGSSWVKASPTNANEIGSYTIAEVDNRLSNKVSVTDYNADMDGIISDIETNSTSISQNKDAIALKADSSRVDTLEGTVSNHSSELNVMSDEISSKVEQSEVDTLVGRVDSAESTITQHSDEIESRVEKNGVVSSINQSSESVEIDANKINLDGHVTANHIKSLDGLNVNGQFVVDGNGNVTLSGELQGATGTFGEVAVKNGDFLLEEESGMTYKVTSENNLLRDHNFELLDTTGTIDATHNWVDATNNSDYGSLDWYANYGPKVAIQLGPDSQEALPIFGEKALVVEYGRFFNQVVAAAPNTQYTFSAFCKKQWNVSGEGSLRLEIWHMDAVGERIERLVSKIFPKVPSDYSVQRHAHTFTTPNIASDESLEVIINGGEKTWVQVDGVQMVEGDVPTVYNAENSHYNFAKGRELAESINTKALRVYDNASFWGRVDIDANLHAEGGAVYSQLTHTGGYMNIRPYNSSYDDGSVARVIYDGNQRRVEFWNTEQKRSQVEAADFVTNSDENAKTDIQLFEGSALDILSQSDVYKYKMDDGKDSEYKYGFVIGDDYNLSPELLSNSNSISSYSHRTLNSKAIQELQRKNDELEQRINELENNTN